MSHELSKKRLEAIITLIKIHGAYSGKPNPKKMKNISSSINV